MEDKFLVELYNVTPALSGQVARLSEVMNLYGDIPTFFGCFYKPIGLEYEVERIHNVMGGHGNSIWKTNPHKHKDANTVKLWTMVKDGSLRNNGMEFVSKPVVGHGIDYALHEIDDLLTNYESDCESSIRTSIHVHVDMVEWRLRELFHLPALYALFENLFFSLHGMHRQNNPYCYKIVDLAPRSARIHGDMKYCALNLAPIEKQITVEFRHADFSKDLRKNRRWIQVVCKFMKYAEEHKENLKEIVEETVITDGYMKLFHEVMGRSVFLFDIDKVQSMMKVNAPWAIATLELL